MAASIWRRAFVDVVTLNRRIPGESWCAFALESTRAVCAHSIAAASARWTVFDVTFVDIDATGRDVAGVVRPAFVAYAERLTAVGATIGVWSAFHIFARCFAGDTRWRANETAEWTENRVNFTS